MWFVTSGAWGRTLGGIEAAGLNASADMGFAVKNILVDGRNHTDVDTLKAMINVEKGDPIFAFKPYEARQMIEKLSWVKTAQVERRLPDTIYVKLEERVPIALWQRHKRLSLIDKEGAVLSEHGLDEFQNLVIVTGEQAPKKTYELLSLIKAEPLIEERVEAASLVSDRRWDLTLKSGAIIKLPEQEIGLALRRLAINHEEEGLLDKNVVSIDVREEGRITVRTKPGAVQEYKAGFKQVGSPI